MPENTRQSREPVWQQVLDTLRRLPRLTLVGWMAVSVIVFMVVLATYALIDPRVTADKVNYAYALLVLPAAMLLVSLPLLRANISGLSVEREMPDRVVAGEPFPVTLRITNRSRFWPRLAIELEDGLPSRLRKIARTTYVLGIAPGQTVLVRYQGLLFTRGQQHIERVTLRSRFPFGLLDGARRLTCRSDVLVFPAIGRLDHPPRLQIGAQQSDIGRTHPRRDAIDQYFGVREYRDGDHPRLIHWKVTARTGELAVREYESETHAPIMVLLDTRIWQRTRRGIGDAELAVSYTATLVNWLERAGRAVSLATFAPRPVLIPPGHGPGHAARVLEALATLRTGTRQYFDELMRTVDPRLARRCHALAILLGPRELYDLAAFQGIFRSITFHSVQDPVIRHGLHLRDVDAIAEAAGAAVV